MTNHGEYTPEAGAAAAAKAAAAGVFAEHAEAIVAALPDVPAGHVLVAIVTAEHTFGGTHHVAQQDIVARIPELETSGWAMVFTEGTAVADVQRRAAEMGTLARRRAEMIDRIRTRRT